MSLETLPNDILINIIKYLNIDDITKLFHTKLFYNLYNDEFISTNQVIRLIHYRYV
jgi:hypothetical protein